MSGSGAGETHGPVRFHGIQIDTLEEFMGISNVPMVWLSGTTDIGEAG